MGRKVRYDTNFNEKMQIMLLARIILVVLVGLAVFILPTFVKLVTFYAEYYKSVFRFIIGLVIFFGCSSLSGVISRMKLSEGPDVLIIFVEFVLGGFLALFGLYLELQFFLEYPLFSILCFAIVASIGGTGGRYAFGYSSKGGFGWFYFV